MFPRELLGNFKRIAAEVEGPQCVRNILVAEWDRLRGVARGYEGPRDSVDVSELGWDRDLGPLSLVVDCTDAAGAQLRDG